MIDQWPNKSPEPPLALAVPLSRFTSRVGGGSAFFVRPHYAHINKHYNHEKKHYQNRQLHRDGIRRRWMRAHLKYSWDVTDDTQDQLGLRASPAGQRLLWA